MAVTYLRKCPSFCLQNTSHHIAFVHFSTNQFLRCAKKIPPVWLIETIIGRNRLFSFASTRRGDGDFSTKVGEQNELVSLESEADHMGLFSELYQDELKPLTIKERVLVLQPDFKWGRRRFLSKAIQNRLDEAESLVHSISNWEVHEKLIEPLHDLNSKYFFGTGKLKVLKNKVASLKETSDLSAVFINTGKLSKKQTSILENTFGCRVYDRYRIVLEIFKERARTKEAKLQVKLAELQYNKWHISSEHRSFDQQRGGTMTVGGGGETHLELKRRLLAEKEAKINKELRHIENQRLQNRTERINNEIPQIALIGYTNAGKTTLAKAMSRDGKLEPENRLFATVDTTAHRGKLPCGVNIVCIDTVGFITDLPHELIKSFSSTLKDVKDATLLVHVRDMAHPERNLQKKSVLDVLENLNVEKRLLENMIEVHNKEDLRSFAENGNRRYEAKKGGDELIISVSALQQTGIDDLMFLVEKKIFDVTGRKIFSLKVSQEGPHLSWLHQHSTVLNTTVVEGDRLEVQAIMDSLKFAKWQNFLRKNKVS